MLLRIVVTQLVVALVTGLVITLAYKKTSTGTSSRASDTEHQVSKKHLIGGDPLNILVMGSDSRAGAGNDIDGQTDIGQRSDTTILVHVSADRKTVYGVSLPRDAMVTRPDCKGDDGKTVPGGDLADVQRRLLARRARPARSEQVESLTGIYIDHYVSSDFNGFKDMVDAVHGVTVCIPEEVDDSAHGITFHAGTQELNGQQALNYVRERYVLSANSDIGRMKRQQAFIASMINKVVSAGTLTRPNRVYEFLKAATGSITTDPGLASLSKLVDLAWQFRKTNLDNISFITVPFEEYPPDPNRLIWTDSAKGLWKVILNDQPLPKNTRRRSSPPTSRLARRPARSPARHRARPPRPVRRPRPRPVRQARVPRRRPTRTACAPSQAWLGKR